MASPFVLFDTGHEAARSTIAPPEIEIPLVLHILHSRQDLSGGGGHSY